jgi:Putative zinc-finger
MKCTQTLEVGAYVLGALVPAERDAFEKHLGECAICREEVADLAVLPGLLGRIDYETARSIAQEGEDSAALFPVGWAGPTAVPETIVPAAAAAETDSPETVRPNVLRPERWAGPTVNADTDARVTDPPNGKVVPLLAAAERRRAREKRRRRFVTAGVGLVAACLALVIGLGIPRMTVEPDPGPVFTAMSAERANLPITADLALEPTASGTRVIMQCQYTGAVGTRREYKLVVVSKTGGDPHEVTDWTAGHGDKFEVSSEAPVKTADIDRVEIRNAEGTVLMTYRP